MKRARLVISILALVSIVATVVLRLALPGWFWHLRGQVDCWFFVAAMLLTAVSVALWLALLLRRAHWSLKVLAFLLLYTPVTLLLLLVGIMYGPVPESVHYNDGRYVITELVADDGISAFRLSRREGLLYHPLGYTSAYYPQTVQITEDEANGWVIVDADSPQWNRPDTLLHTCDTLPWNGEDWLDRRRRYGIKL